MLKQFSALIVWLSLSPFIAVAINKKCSVSPAKSAAIVDDTHEIKCLSDPGTMILSWKLGLEPEASTYNFSGIGIYKTHDAYVVPAYSSNISCMGILGTSESLRQIQTEGYMTNYLSLRMSTMKITRVKDNQARPIYCFVLDISDRKTLHCESKLNVFVKRPSFGSTGIALAKGIVTNITCAVSFKGAAILEMKITDKRNVLLNQTVQNFTDFGVHSYELMFLQQVRIIPERSGHTVSSDLGVQSAFFCSIILDRRDVYERIVECEVDAPVTYVSIVPDNATRCSQRRCYIHEHLTCTSDGRPKPNKFEWRLSLMHDAFSPMLGSDAYQYALISGRNTFECRVFNKIGDYTFTAVGRLTIHVDAFEWKLDEYATYEAKGNKHKVWYPVTIHATVTGIILVFLPCYRS